MCKKLIAAIAVGCVAFAVSAQNARLDAMAGVGIVDDITGIIGNPADVTEYGDQIQGTVGDGVSAAAFGAVIATKSIGSVLTLGLLANVQENKSSVLRSDFYDDGAAAVDNTATGNIDAGLLNGPADEFPPIPHLLVGLDLGSVALGFDLFVEMARQKSNSEASDGTKTTNKARLSNIGGVASANLDLGSVTMSPLIGFGLPRISGLYESDPGGGAPIVTEETGSDKGLFVKGGSEVSFAPGDLDWTAGLFYTMESYRFFSKVGGTTTNDDMQPHHFVEAYVGITTELFTDLLLAAQYSYGLEISQVKAEVVAAGTTTNTTTTDPRTASHSAGLGLEKPFDGFWIFDRLITRAGLLWNFTSPGDHTDSEWSGATSGDSEDKNKEPINSQNVALTVGAGMTKGRGQVDVLVDLGNWNGVISGPQGVQATLTIDFGKTSSSVSSYETPAPMPAVRPASEDTETKDTDTEAPTDDFGF